MGAIWSSEVFGQFAATLAQTEVLPRPALDAYRDSLLTRLVSFAYNGSPFYRDRLKPLFRNSDSPDLRAWRDIPILTRADLTAHAERINPVFVPKESGNVVTRKTSGTTGANLEFRICDLTRLAAECMMHRLYRWHGFELDAPLASIRYYSSGRRRYPEGITEPFWCFSQAAPHYTLDWRTSVENMIEWLGRRRPAYLLTFPSIAHDLARHSQAARIAELGLGPIVSISEILSWDTRADVRRILGCEMAQIYACGEMGCIALESELDDHCSVCEETVYVEILDERGVPVGPGETGRVVLTSLYNYATPFIRYEIGDYATLSDQRCPAGRTLQRLARIMGRKRNALRTRSGRRLWEDTVVSESFRRHMPGHVFQIRQLDIETIEVAYVSDDASCKPNELVLVPHFATLLGGPVNVRLTRLNDIARSTGGKRERIVTALVD